MKKLLFLSIIVLLLLNFHQLYSQKLSKSDLDKVGINNFVVDNCKIKWVKIFELQITKDQLINHINNSHLAIKHADDSTIFGTFDNVSIVGTKYRYKDFLTGTLSGAYRIDIREKRYRVIVSDIKESTNNSDFTKTLEWYALNKKCEIKSVFGFPQYIGKMLEIMFTDWFIFQGNSIEDW